MAVLQELREAIDEALNCKLGPEDIERARRVLRKEEAREVLVNAIDGQKRSTLTRALDAAKQFDDEMPEIDTAQKLLKKLDVSRDISLALGKQNFNDIADVQVLRQIVDDAKLQGVESAKVSKAQQLIWQLEKDGYT